MSESIYQIIPHLPHPEQKTSIYKSKYPPNIPPTASTFGNHTTSKPIASNLSGQFTKGFSVHTECGTGKTFGYLRGDRQASGENFLKKQTGRMGKKQLPEVRNFSYDSNWIKEKVPRQNDTLLGKKSHKNFILSNAVDCILSCSKKEEEKINWLEKKNYGRVPRYLEETKENINTEYKLIQKQCLERENKQKYLDDEEVRELRKGLKKKWNDVNKQYQKKSYLKLVDSHGLKTRKELYEKQMNSIEEDIKKLNKTYILIEDERPLYSDYKI